jgi:hypothetical protein
MTEFLFRGYKCKCGTLVKMAQLDKAGTAASVTQGQGFVGSVWTCPYCYEATWVKNEILTEWTEQRTVN